MNDSYDELAHRIINEYPQPIAFAVFKLEERRDEHAGFEAALRAFEETTRYLALVGVAHYLHHLDLGTIERDSRFEASAGSLVLNVFGKWLQLLRELENAMPFAERPWLDAGIKTKLELPTWLALHSEWTGGGTQKISTNDLLGTVVAIRNNKEHPKRPMDERKLTPLLRRALLTWLDDLSYLTEVPPQHVDSVQATGRTSLRVTMRPLVGTAAALQKRRSCSKDIQLWPGVWLWNGEGDPISFFPLAVAADEGKMLRTLVQVEKGVPVYRAADPNFTPAGDESPLDGFREQAPFLLEFREPEQAPEPTTPTATEADELRKRALARYEARYRQYCIDDGQLSAMERQALQDIVDFAGLTEEEVERIHTRVDADPEHIAMVADARDREAAAAAPPEVPPTEQQPEPDAPTLPEGFTPAQDGVEAGTKPTAWACDGETWQVESWREILLVTAAHLAERSSERWQAAAEDELFHGKKWDQLALNTDRMNKPVEIAGVFMETDRHANNVLKYSLRMAEYLGVDPTSCGYKLAEQEEGRATENELTKAARALTDSALASAGTVTKGAGALFSSITRMVASEPSDELEWPENGRLFLKQIKQLAVGRLAFEPLHVSDDEKLEEVDNNAGSLWFMPNDRHSISVWFTSKWGNSIRVVLGFYSEHKSKDPEYRACRATIDEELDGEALLGDWSLSYPKWKKLAFEGNRKIKMDQLGSEEFLAETVEALVELSRLVASHIEDVQLRGDSGGSGAGTAPEGPTVWHLNVGGRSLADGLQHGYWQAGGGKRYRTAVERLEPGDEVYLYCSGVGYLAAGVVTGAQAVRLETLLEGRQQQVDEVTAKYISRSTEEPDDTAEWTKEVTWRSVRPHDNGVRVQDHVSGWSVPVMTACRILNTEVIAFLALEFEGD